MGIKTKITTIINAAIQLSCVLCESDFAMKNQHLFYAFTKAKEKKTSWPNVVFFSCVCAMIAGIKPIP